MSRVRALVLLCLLALLTPAANAGKQKVGYMKRPGSAEVTGLTLVPAGGDCADWAWAAAAQSILALDGVHIDQHVLLQKAYGGELCDDRLNLQALADVVNGDYQLGPRKGMKVVTRVFPAGAPLVEDLIAGVKRNRPMIVVYRGHPYVAIRVDYDEYIGPNGARIWDARVITLLDPTAADEEHRRIVFDKSKDDGGGFDGATDFSLFPTEQVDWIPPQ